MPRGRGAGQRDEEGEKPHAAGEHVDDEKILGRVAQIGRDSPRHAYRSKSAAVFKEDIQ